MTFSARMAKVAELPTEVVGMMPPSRVIATASTTATSIGPIWRERSSSTVSERCWSINITSPLFRAARSTGRTGTAGGASAHASSVNTSSMPLPSDAPVISVMPKGFGRGALCQCQWHGLGIAGAGKSAHADGHAILDQRGGLLGRADLVHEGRTADAVIVHGGTSILDDVLRAGGRTGRRGRSAARRRARARPWLRHESHAGQPLHEVGPHHVRHQALLPARQGSLTQTATVVPTPSGRGAS
jgi:hypothetical protein